MLGFVQNSLPKINRIKNKPNRKKNGYLWLILMALLSAIAWFVVATNENRKQRIERIEAENLEKFKQDSARLNDCVQYALLATVEGFYPCYSCEDSTQIFLKKDEVWYYGETCYEENRYSDIFYDKNNLVFIQEFQGNKYDVLLQQKRKIYNYISFVENVKRRKPLLRPPGNKRNN